MTDEQFWKLIAKSKRGAEDCDEQAERLTELLKKLPPEEIRDFDKSFRRRLREAYRWDLWAVAYIVNGGSSDDGFEYFRCWLIGQGQKAFETVLASPSKIGKWIEEDEEAEGESLLYAAGEAYEGVTGDAILIDSPDTTSLEEPLGEEWEEDELPYLFPRLWKRFAEE